MGFRVGSIWAMAVAGRDVATGVGGGSSVGDSVGMGVALWGSEVGALTSKDSANWISVSDKRGICCTSLSPDSGRL